MVAGDLNPSRWRTGAARSLSKARKRSPKAASAAVGAAGASPLSPCSRISRRLPKRSLEMCARLYCFFLNFFVVCCVPDSFGLSEERSGRGLGFAISHLLFLDQAVEAMKSAAHGIGESEGADSDSETTGEVAKERAVENAEATEEKEEESENARLRQSALEKLEKASEDSVFGQVSQSYRRYREMISNAFDWILCWMMLYRSCEFHIFLSNLFRV